MSASVSARLLFLYIADTSAFLQPTIAVTNAISAVGAQAAASAQGIQSMGVTLQNQNMITTTALGTTRDLTEAWASASQTIMRMSSIARQVIGMYTSWTVWQIRLTQYTNQVRDAQRRHERLLRELTGVQTEYGEATRRTLDLLNKLADAELNAVIGWDKVRRATGNLIIAIGRYGEESEEARQSALDWSSTLMTWAETARKAGVSTEAIEIAIGNLEVAISRGMIPNWESFRDIITETGDTFDPFGTAGRTAFDIVAQGADLATTAAEYTRTTMEEVMEEQQNFSEQMTNAVEDVEAALKKLELAEREVALMSWMMGFQAAGVIVQLVNLVISLGGATLATWAYNAAALVGNAIMTLGVGTVIALAAATAGLAAMWILAQDSIEGTDMELSGVTTEAGKTTEGLLGLEEQALDTAEALDAIHPATATRPAGLPDWVYEVAEEEEPPFQAGGVIPVTRKYKMHAGEIVTPESMASRGERFGEGGGAGGGNNYYFGDIRIEVQQLAREQDFRETAIKMRQYLESETARTL